LGKCKIGFLNQNKDFAFLSPKQINPRSLEHSDATKNWTIFAQSGFFGSFVAPWSEWSWTNLFSKETQTPFLDLRIQLLLFFSIFKETCSSILRFAGHVLSGHAISTHQVYSLPDCHALCLRHPRCLSYNYQVTAMSSSHSCEINDATGKMCPQDMIETKGFKYYEDRVNKLMTTSIPARRLI